MTYGGACFGRLDTCMSMLQPMWPWFLLYNLPQCLYCMPWTLIVFVSLTKIIYEGWLTKQDYGFSVIIYT